MKRVIGKRWLHFLSRCSFDEIMCGEFRLIYGKKNTDENAVREKVGL